MDKWLLINQISFAKKECMESLSALIDLVETSEKDNANKKAN